MNFFQQFITRPLTTVPEDGRMMWVNVTVTITALIDCHDWYMLGKLKLFQLRLSFLEV